jgi:HK97 family phage prohead protease
MAKVGGEEIDLTPTDGMAREAQKALDWKKDGHAGGTAVGMARAHQLVSKEQLSPSTVRRMHSFFSRHEVDKKGEGFSPGEPGYPSNGRVAWALWGGDPGQTWARAKSETLDRLEGKSIDYTKEYTEEQDIEEKAGPKDLKIGDLVTWGSSGGAAKGKIERIVRDGSLNVPDSSFTIEGTKEDPAALIRIYKEGKETDTLVGHKFSTLTKVSSKFLEDTLCPVVTQDADTNIAHHLVAIKEANLGPADPTASSDTYWNYMAEQWMVSSDEARVRQCQNCEYYDNSPKILDCLKSSTFKASDLPLTPKWADVTAESGHCTKWDITCTSIRTCVSWEPDADDGEDDTGEVEMEDDTSNLDGQMISLSMNKPVTKMFTFDSVIKAVDAGEGELKIDGYASTVSVDRSADVILASAWNKSGGLNNYKSNPILLFNHNYDKPIGKVVEMGTDNKGLRIKGVISKSAGDVYDLVKEGVLTTFSVGFLIKDADYDQEKDGLIIKDAELLEVSVVSVPCNQDATFSVAKSFDSQDDYLTFRKQFENALGGQPSAETGGSSEGAKQASRKLKMEENTNEAIQKAVADALAAQKAAEVAAATKAAEAQATEDKIVAKVLETGSEKLYAELEKRFKDDKIELDTKLEGLRTEIAEKSTELQAIANSKRVFADRSDGDAWKKELLPEMENAFLLGRITGKGYDTKYAQALMQKAANAMSSVQVSGDNFEREVTTNIEREIQLELVLAPLFREIQMNSASMILPIMPDTSYAQITSSAGSTSLSNPNGTLDDRGSTHTASPTGGIALTELDLRTIKMVAKSYLANETEEDAIIPVLPLLREAMIRQHARGVENLMLLGGLEGPYSGLTSGAIGLLKYASTTSGGSTTARTNTSGTAFASDSLTSLALLALRKKMGKYGIRPNDVVYVVSQRGYFELLEDSEFQDFNLVGNIATKMTGEVGQIFGSSVLVCDEFPAPAVGKYYALAVNTRNFVVPRQRGVTVESQYLVENQHRVLTTTQRLGFNEVIKDATAVVGLKYAAA